MLIAVGSQNPVKVLCVRGAVRKFWPAAEAEGVAAQSGISDQPMSDEETLRGAMQRARHALELMPEAELGVGLEGGLTDHGGDLWAFAWCAILNRRGVVGQGKTGMFRLPRGVAELVRGGMELGHADDVFFGKQDSKKKEGAIGLLTNGKMDRRQLYEPAVVFALLPFLHPELYR
ncbi:MAG: inosine/xanthosine triphosphatase [Bryobacteraceae bacterium]